MFVIVNLISRMIKTFFTYKHIDIIGWSISVIRNIVRCDPWLVQVSPSHKFLNYFQNFLKVTNLWYENFLYLTNIEHSLTMNVGCQSTPPSIFQICLINFPGTEKKEPINFVCSPNSSSSCVFCIYTILDETSMFCYLYRHVQNYSLKFSCFSWKGWWPWVLINRGNLNQPQIVILIIIRHLLISQGLGLLHWASDRGLTSMVELLLSLDADINLTVSFSVSFYTLLILLWPKIIWPTEWTK